MKGGLELKVLYFIVAQNYNNYLSTKLYEVKTMIKNRITIDEEKNRAILWLDVQTSIGKISIPSYIDNDPEVIRWVEEMPSNVLYALYPGKWGYLPYVRGCIKDENGKEHNFFLHRYLIKKKYVKLPKDKQVHHINGLRHDNRLENLIAVTSEEHGKYSKRTKKEPPPNDPNGFTGTVINPKSKRIKDEHGTTLRYENIRPTYVYVHGVFLGYFAPEKTNLAAWQINVCKLLFEQNTRQEIHRLLNPNNLIYNREQIDKAIEAVLKLLNWEPPFL